MSDTLTQEQLQSYLWGAATILRGLVDAGDYKQFIFPVVFFKRLSDVWDEDYARALDAYGGAQDVARTEANERFTIPEGAHWSDVRKTPKNVGKVIQDAMRAIEAANPGRLDGIFGDAPWTNKNRLPDHTLKSLLEHFSSQTLSIARVAEDSLGDGYEYLVGKFADDGGSTAQEFYTNRTLVHLMAQMLRPRAGESIYDPTCGTGGMLLSALAQVKRAGGEHRTLKLSDFALLKEVLLLAVSIQDAGLTGAVGRPLFRRLFDDVRHPETGFFCELFVQSLENLVEKHCAGGWPADARGRSNARREVNQFLKSQALGEDRTWQLLCLEYLRGSAAEGPNATN